MADRNLRTHDGYPARQNSDGSYSTELLGTVQHPDLNGGRWTNVPTLWGGQEVDEDQAVAYALRSGKYWPAFESMEQAVEAAERRSAGGGASQPDLEQNFRAGGAVRQPEDDLEGIEDQAERDRNTLHREYRPDEPGSAFPHRTPDKSYRIDTPESDTFYEIIPNHPDLSAQEQAEQNDNRHQWVPNYQQGGLIAPAKAPRNKRPLITGRATRSGGT